MINNSIRIAIEGIVLTDESISAIKYLQEENGTHDKAILEEVIDILLSVEPDNEEYRHRFNLIQDVRMIAKKLSILSTSKK